MKYYIGIDGGGTKTQFALCNEWGHVCAAYTTTGSSYKELGAQGVCSLLIEGIEQICTGIDKPTIAGICFGMPCYGESSQNDALVTEMIEKALCPLPIHFENDVYAAWAGALAFECGINLLAGTGSMAVGRDRHGAMKRSGGWSEFFSDEGSCYWLGKKALELFSKQSDNRLPKDGLYEIVRTHFSLQKDFELMEIIESDYMKSRKKVASLQKLLMESALQGDVNARLCYEQAAYELAMMVRAVHRSLDFEPQTPVSYSGGLFETGKLILTPFKKALCELDVVLRAPLLLPVEGAILFAVECFDKSNMQQIKDGLLNKSGARTAYTK